ncbi:phenylacetic acid degradation operon negative regulatory protein PaaX [Alkalihalobacillus deserti]|uniref:phenylacetic acid degradation operon negative regulatory protein PaaX n=1 Tax=Alkalihalobacillus deserti TaxID=2879466 RepID=UPI001D14CF09|nr:phenylacetic acid degradation operon negative regulatory protein PaaX [Alkalihalobacillus deserti]
MENTLNTRSMIFTLYGDYIRHYGNEIWIGSLISLLQEFGHNEQSVRAAISRMNKQGWIQSKRVGNKSFYSLTDIGKARMEEAAERIYKIKPHSWDGKWRILMYNIPEEIRNVRDELRQELIWSGFGSMSTSCWLSPNPLEKQVYGLIEKYEIKEYVNFFISQYDGPKEDQSLIKKCWNLDEINERYEEFMREYSQKYVIAKNKIEKGNMTDGQCFVERTILVHEYRKFLFIDPGLPAELLPDKWLGDSAADLFSEYYVALAKKASQFFEGVFRKGNEKVKVSKDFDVLSHPLMIDTE